MGRIGWTEILVLALILVVLFGATKIPAIGRGVGEGIRELKKALKGDDAESKGGVEGSDKKSS